jgi:hypothetical protein
MTVLTPSLWVPVSRAFNLSPKRQHWALTYLPTYEEACSNVTWYMYCPGLAATYEYFSLVSSGENVQKPTCGRTYCYIPCCAVTHHAATYFTPRRSAAAGRSTCRRC